MQKYTFNVAFRPTKLNLWGIIVALLLPCIAACTSPELLTPRDGTVPAGVNLSGNWNIQPTSALAQRRIREAIRKTDGVDDETLFGGSQTQSGRTSSRRRGNGQVKGGLVDVFLELGDALKITQTDYGLFISFDRSVVEEYRFGGRQTVSVGQVVAQRVVGWEDSTLIVETLDRNSMKLTERFRLIENNQVLERTIILRSKSMDEERVVQLFDRVAN